MILGFSTQINSKPTYFVEKIYKGVLNCLGYKDFHIQARMCFDLRQNKNYNVDKLLMLSTKPKLHTIRDDKNDRWKVGTKIDFFINCRQKDMFRFAPVLPVVIVQEIHIMYRSGNIFFADRMYSADVYIDKRKLSVSELTTLAQNDGFENVEDFFAYFDKDFNGKIIHWTDLKY